MAEMNVSLPTTSSSSDGSASEDSWTFLDELDDSHAVNKHNDSVPLTTTATDEIEIQIENATEAVALNGNSALDAVTDHNVDDASGVEVQRYGISHFISFYRYYYNAQYTTSVDQYTYVIRTRFTLLLFTSR